MSRTVESGGITYFYEAHRSVGASFPAGVAGGWVHYHTTHKELFVWDGDESGWWGQSTHDLYGGSNATETAPVYSRIVPLGGVTTRYSATFGESYGYPVRVTGLQVCAEASSTATVQVHDDGVAVTGASLSIAATTIGQDDTIDSATIAASSVLGLYVSSGSLDTGYIVSARLRRFET